MSRFPLLISLLLVSCALAMAANKPWVEVRSPHFRVLTDSSQKDGVQVAREFERMRAVFALQFPDFRLETGTPLLILVPRDDSSMKALVPWIWRYEVKPTAYFHHGWNKQYAVIRADTMQSDNPDRYGIVYHEFIYSVLRSNFRSLPVWLEEGFAQFYGYTRFEQSRMMIGAAPRNRGLTKLLESKHLIPLEVFLAVNRSSPYLRDRTKVYWFYAQAWALTHFLFFGPEAGNGAKMKQFIDLLQQGVDQKKAFEDTFGVYRVVEYRLNLYLSKFAFPDLEGEQPGIEDKNYATRTLTVAETDTELGGFSLSTLHVEQARPLIERAVKEDPALGLGHENMGFLEFSDGKDEAASREFSKALELDQKLYLSLYWNTLLSPKARSNEPADEAVLHDELLKVLDLNSGYAPAYLELAKLYLRQGNFTKAFGGARRAEQLEPSRAGYHLLSGQILLRLGRGAEAASFAKYVADRWSGADRDEAIELWNTVPAAQRPATDVLTEVSAEGIQTLEGKVKSITCGQKDEEEELVIAESDEPINFTGGTLILDNNGRVITFAAKKWSAELSDTLWYGKADSDFCHRVIGKRIFVRYRPDTDKDRAGYFDRVELRDDLPPIRKQDEAQSKGR